MAKTKLITSTIMAVGFVACMWMNATAQQPDKSKKDSALPEQVPAISTEQSLSMQIIGLKQQLSLLQGQLSVCQAQLAPDQYKKANEQLLGEAQAIVAQFEKDHPGWTLDLTSMTAKKKDTPSAEK